MDILSSLRDHQDSPPPAPLDTRIIKRPIFTILDPIPPAMGTLFEAKEELYVTINRQCKLKVDKGSTANLLFRTLLTVFLCGLPGQKYDDVKNNDMAKARSTGRMRPSTLFFGPWNFYHLQMIVYVALQNYKIKFSKSVDILCQK